jgi:hypothetical protein
LWNPEATIEKNHAVLFVVLTFLRHVRIRHFLEVVLEVKRARYCDIKSKTEEKIIKGGRN